MSFLFFSLFSFTFRSRDASEGRSNMNMYPRVLMSDIGAKVLVYRVTRFEIINGRHLDAPMLRVYPMPQGSGIAFDSRGPVLPFVARHVNDTFRRFEVINIFKSSNIKLSTYRYNVLSFFLLSSPPFFLVFSSSLFLFFLFSYLA